VPGSCACPRPTALALAALVAVALAAAPGCSTWRGARLYASGTDALEAGDAFTAIAHLERAAELVPRSAEVQNHLGIAYLQAGRPEAARRAFARAVALDCRDPAAAVNLKRLEARRENGGSGAGGSGPGLPGTPAREERSSAPEEAL